MCRKSIVGAFLLFLPAVAQHGSTTAVNPYTGPEHAVEGAKLFRAQCAGCHGIDGAGTGAGPSLTSGTFQRGGSDEALFLTISKGVPGTSMPAFSFSGLKIWQLVTHMRSLVIARGPAQFKGDAQAGALVFATHCSGCHTVAGRGGLVGPELTEVGSRRSYAEMRKSLLDPHADVASEFWSVAIRMTSGQTLRGIRLNEDTHSLQMRDERGRLVSVLKREVAESELIRRSHMPAFAGKLSEAQINDVLVYLTQLKGE